ncbi:hypothetical protein Acsp02_45140 [Actinoplanes sp. NBRC 103695]|nr:hypothetical protein Acsp02_45140 [Actinoplanes sp. NBRC 103695]
MESPVAARPRRKKTFSRLAQRLALIAAMLVSAAGVTAVMSTPAQAGVILGGLELHSHCARHQSIPTLGWVSYAELRPEVGGDSAYWWRCVRNPGGVLQYWPIDFTSACREQYGANTYAGLLDGIPNWDRWRCVRP